MDSLPRMGAAVFCGPARSGGLTAVTRQPVGGASAICRSSGGATQSGTRAYHVGHTVSFCDSDGIGRNGNALGYRATGHARAAGSQIKERSQGDHNGADRDWVSSITYGNPCYEKTQSEYSAPICWSAAWHPPASFCV